MRLATLEPSARDSRRRTSSCHDGRVGSAHAIHADAHAAFDRARVRGRSCGTLSGCSTDCHLGFRARSLNVVTVSSVRWNPERKPLSRYRVTLRRDSVEIVTADNPFQAAIVAADLFGEGVEVADVRPAIGRAPATTRTPMAKKTVKKVAKKRRPMSPEARAKLAKNLVKARAARARNVKAAKKATKKRATKKVAKKVGRPAKKRPTKRA